MYPGSEDTSYSVSSQAGRDHYATIREIDELFPITNWNDSFEILMIDRPDFLSGGIVELHSRLRLEV